MFASASATNAAATRTIEKAGGSTIFIITSGSSWPRRSLLCLRSRKGARPILNFLFYFFFSSEPGFPTKKVPKRGNPKANTQIFSESNRPRVEPVKGEGIGVICVA
jgi:hypothetical protein